MDSQTIAQWIVIAFAVVGGGWAVYKSRQARNQSNQATGIARQNADAMDRIAKALEQQIATRDRGASASAGVSPGVRVDSAWGIQWIGGDRYRLRNFGPGTASNVRLADATSIVWPTEPRNLAPMESVDFYLAGSFGAPAPGELRIISDEHPEPVIVAIP